MKKVQVSELVKDMGLPEETVFVGYGIHLQENDEFLMSYDSSSEVTNMCWVKLPDMAKHFQSLKKAEKTRDKIKPEAKVVWMFDTGPQVVVTQPEGYE